MEVTWGNTSLAELATLEPRPGSAAAVCQGPVFAPDLVLTVREAGALVAFGVVVDRLEGMLLLRLAGARDVGAGGALLEEFEARARRSGLPKVRVGALADEHVLHRAARARGYELAEEQLQMARPAERLEVAVPAGVTEVLPSSPAAAVALLDARAFAEQPHTTPLTEAEAAEEIAGAQVAFAAADGELAAFSVVRGAELATLGVIPAARGRGVGRFMLRRAIDRVARAGAPRITLSVFAENAAALALYRREGFAETGRRVYLDRPVS